MTNPKASGWYWVWRQPKDIDRNISEAMYWSNGAGWHDDDVASRVTEGPHTHEFAAWVGPLTSRVPPESREEVEAELAANARVATRTTLRPPMTRERLDEIDAEAKCPLLEVGFLGASVPAQAMMALGAAQRLVSKQGAIIVELTTAVRSLLAQCEGYADGYDVLNAQLARLSGLAKTLPSGRIGPGIVYEEPDDSDGVPTPASMLRLKCGLCGHHLGIGRVVVSDPLRFCPSCGTELGDLPPAPDAPVCEKPPVVHITGCELGSNWKDCPACLKALAEGV